MLPRRTCWPTTTSITTRTSISTNSTPPSANSTVSFLFLLFFVPPVVDMETELKGGFSFSFSLFFFIPSTWEWELSAGAHFPAVKSFSNTTSQVIYFFVLLFSLFASSPLSHPRVVSLCQPSREKVLGPFIRIRNETGLIYSSKRERERER